MTASSALVVALLLAWLGLPTGSLGAGQVISGQLPRILKRVEPTYPPELREKRIQGVVFVRITVGTDGRVTDATIAKSIPGLDAAAIAAVRQWEFDPRGMQAPASGVVMLSFNSLVQRQTMTSEARLMPVPDVPAAAKQETQTAGPPKPSEPAAPTVPPTSASGGAGVKPPPIRSGEELTPKPAPEPTVVMRRVTTSVPVWRYRPTLGQVIMSNLTNAVRSVGAANLQLAQINQQIANARARYWKAFPSSPGFATAEAEFSRLLWAKDGWYLMWALPEGKRSPMKDSDEMTSGLDVLKRVTLPLDDGIRRQASTTFDDLVAAMRYEMGVRRANDIAPTFVPGKTMAALRASSDKLEAYLRARDWAEFLASGIDIRKYIEPQTYALQLVEDRILQESWGAGIKRPSPESEAVRVYSAMVEVVGEPAVLAAAAKVLAAEQKHGRLIKPMSITSIEGSLSVTSPRRAFESLLFSEPRGAAVFAVMGTGIYSQRWEDALAGYRELVAKYGEKNVLSAAAQVLKAEKSPLGLIEHRRPGWWLGQLLEKPGLTLPGPIRRLAVSDIDGLKAAAGRTVVATGTVSHVIEESGGGAVRYMRLFFKEAGNSVSARTYGFVPTFEGRYGDRGANIVGKTIEITSDFWVNSDGILFRLTDIAQIKVIR
ncbi:MAG TPA: TonB family protein [Vicinamibacterales bacterium]|nr:TonB family protein [Vicinamibacterales bacterium]